MWSLFRIELQLKAGPDSSPPPVTCVTFSFKGSLLPHAVEMLPQPRLCARKPLCFRKVLARDARELTRRLFTSSHEEATIRWVLVVLFNTVLVRRRRHCSRSRTAPFQSAPRTLAMFRDIFRHAGNASTTGRRKHRRSSAGTARGHCARLAGRSEVDI